jgi:hypothetical protein
LPFVWVCVVDVAEDEPAVVGVALDGVTVGVVLERPAAKIAGPKVTSFAFIGPPRSDP